MTTVRAKSDLSLSQAIPYSFSPPRSSGESSPRDQDSRADESLHHTPSRAFYIPAGSVSSHEGDSLSDTQEPSLPPMDLRFEDSESITGFQPTSDNVIVFEVYTPPNQALPSQRHTSKKFLFSEDVCFQIPEEKDSPKLEDRPLSSADALASLGYSEDEEELPASNRSGQSSDREVAKLQEMLRNAASENDKLRNEISARDIRIQSLEMQKKAKPETSSKQTMTNLEDSSEMQRLKRENEQLASTCSRYERQNQDLRQEVQTCASDLTNAERSKGKLTKEFKRINQLVSTYEGEMTRIAEFVTKILSPETEETWEDKDPRHISNYLASKMEIISSRHSRLQAMHENKLEECEKLKQELQVCRAALKAQETQGEDTVKQLTARLKTKESIIQKLEGRVKDSSLEQMKPRNHTENFTYLLRGLAENSTPPRKSTQGTRKSFVDPTDLEDITEKPCVESDEEMYASHDHSDSNSRNELNKTETPIQVKHQLRKAKLDSSKPPHVRTQSYMHSLLASETRGPVLTYKEALKDLREISTRASRAIEESSLTRMQVRQSHMQEVKSSSADRRRKQKDVGASLKSGVKVAEEPKVRKYRSPYGSAVLKW